MRWQDQGPHSNFACHQNSITGTHDFSSTVSVRVTTPPVLATPANQPVRDVVDVADRARATRGVEVALVGHLARVVGAQRAVRLSAAAEVEPGLSVGAVEKPGVAGAAAWSASRRAEGAIADHRINAGGRVGQVEGHGAGRGLHDAAVDVVVAGAADVEFAARLLDDHGQDHPGIRFGLCGNLEDLLAQDLVVGFGVVAAEHGQVDGPEGVEVLPPGHVRQVGRLSVEALVARRIGNDGMVHTCGSVRLVPGKGGSISDSGKA